MHAKRHCVRPQNLCSQHKRNQGRKMLMAVRLECHTMLRIGLPSVGIDQFCLADPQISFRLGITQITRVSFAKFSAEHSHEKYYRKVQAYFSRKQETKLMFFMIRIRGLLKQSKIQLAIGYVSIGTSPGFRGKDDRQTTPKNHNLNRPFRDSGHLVY